MTCLKQLHYAKIIVKAIGVRLLYWSVVHTDQIQLQMINTPVLFVENAAASRAVNAQTSRYFPRSP